MFSFLKPVADRERPNISNFVRIKIPNEVVSKLASISVRVRSKQTQERTERMFPWLSLEQKRGGDVYRSMEPGWTYVTRQGRDRKPCFVRTTPGRTVPRYPPPWPIPEWDVWLEPERALCPGCPECYGSDISLGSDWGSDWESDSDYGPAPSWFSSGASVLSSRPTSSTYSPSFGAPPTSLIVHTGSGSLVKRAGHRQHASRHQRSSTPNVLFNHSRPRPHPSSTASASPSLGRRVHWPDGGSDGSLAQCPGLNSSSSSSSSSSAPRHSHRRHPQTPPSSPGGGARLIHRSPRNSGQAYGGGHGGSSRRRRGSYERMRGGVLPSGSRWREMPYYDQEYGLGIVREPRF